MEHMSFALPVDRLVETPRLVAFRHPKPAYPVHILIVPKKDVRDLVDLSAWDEGFVAGFSGDLLACVTRLVQELNLEAVGYRLIVNGGPYQEVPVLHFHLVSGGNRV
jgi:histidine triad (HIT) family protein